MLPPEQQRSPYLNHVTTVVPFLRKIGDNRTPVAYQKVSISMDEIGDLMSVLPNGNRQLILYSVLHDTVLVTKSSDETIPLMKINKDTLSQIGNLLEQENWGKLSSKNGLYLSFARPVKYRLDYDNGNFVFLPLVYIAQYSIYMVTYVSDSGFELSLFLRSNIQIRCFAKSTCWRRI